MKSTTEHDVCSETRGRRQASAPAGSAGRIGLIVAVAAAASAFGCEGNYNSPGGAPPDEAMVRAIAEGKTVKDAARDYFYPKKIVDYFGAMDSVGRTKEGATDWPDALLDRKESPYVRKGQAREGRELSPFKLTDKEAFGRNAWMIWCAGNEGFWDWVANNSYGSSDVLKLLDSRKRSSLFRETGLINEPEMRAVGSPEETDFGLWLSVPSDERDRAWRTSYLKYAFTAKGRDAGPGYSAEGPYRAGPGAPGGYGGKPDAGEGRGGASYDGSEGEYDYDYEDKYPPPEIYGLSSGVIGFRLFPNPNFDEEARKRWDPKRYYDDPDYYSDPKLVRPFRVGMSCAICHTSFHPLKPPRDVTDPGWENLSGNTGAQYLRIRGVFGNLMTPESFVYHILDSQPPGTIDTSLIPSDNINNTNAMNSIFALPQRVALSFKNPEERQQPASGSLPSLWTKAEFDEGLVPKEFLDAIPGLPESNGNPRAIPRVLFDGADSIGGYGALSRVFLNIGLYWEQWIRIHESFVGFRPQEPFRIDDCASQSVYWNATQLRVPGLRDYFLRITPPMRLLDVAEDRDRTAPIDEDALRREAQAAGMPFEEAFALERAKRIDTSKLAAGRRVFARNCIVCHSSIQPPERHEEMAAFAAKGEFWDHDPGRWLADPKYRAWAEAEVEKPEFWLDNFLSTDYRIAVNYVKTNSARAVATNALPGHMWSDYASADYQSMPSVGSIPFFNPYLGEHGGEDSYTPRHASPAGLPGGGGPGFYRVPTLISIWAAAPLLHNNSLGLFNNDPSVDGRLVAFDDAIRKLLWPARRLESSSYNEATPERLKADHGLIWRTPVESHLTLSARQVPFQLSTRVGAFMRLLFRYPWLQDLRWLWLPAGLILASFLVLWRLPSTPFRRFVFGYVPLILGLLIGFTIFFVNGRLGDVRIGPIPKGTPVNLLANVNPDAPPDELWKAIKVTTGALAEIKSKRLDEADAQKVLREKAAPALMEVSRCPDFVMDKGHDYPWFRTMSDDDKSALIELLKTF